MNIASHPAGKWHSAGEAGYLPYRNSTYRRRRRPGQEERQEEDRQFHLTVSIGKERHARSSAP